MPQEPILTAEPVKTAGWASQLIRVGLRDRMEDPETPATILFLIALDNFGTEFFDWDPETIRLELIDDLNARPPQSNIDKILAIVTYLTSDLFFRSLEAFIPIVNTLNDNEANFTDFDPADMEEMAWAISELHLIDPIDNPKEQFSDEIRTYVGAQAREEGFSRLPPMLVWGSMEDTSEDRVDQFQDDPVMFNAIFDHQTKNLDAVVAYARARLNRLFTLLKDLPLMNGSTKDLLKKSKK